MGDWPLLAVLVAWFNFAHGFWWGRRWTRQFDGPRAEEG